MHVYYFKLFVLQRFNKLSLFVFHSDNSTSAYFSFCTFLTQFNNNIELVPEFSYLFPSFSLFPSFPSLGFLYSALTLLDQYAGFQLIHGGYSPRQMANGKHYNLPYRPSQNHTIVLRIIQRTICVSQKCLRVENLCKN